MREKVHAILFKGRSRDYFFMQDSNCRKFESENVKTFHDS